MGYKTVDLRDETEELLVPEEVRQHPAWVRLTDQLLTSAEIAKRRW